MTFLFLSPFSEKVRSIKYSAVQKIPNASFLGSLKRY